MQYIALIMFLAAAIATCASSALITVRTYRALPPQVPDYFDGSGWPDAYGPRPMIFVAIFCEVALIAIWSVIVFNTIPLTNALRVIFVSGIIVNALVLAIAALQRDTLAVAQQNRPKYAIRYAP